MKALDCTGERLHRHTCSREGRFLPKAVRPTQGSARTATAGTMVDALARGLTFSCRACTPSAQQACT